MCSREEEQPSEELKSLESALRSLKPADSSIDRDRLMYLAGQAAVQPARSRFVHRSLWPLAMAASVMIAAVLGRVTAPERVHVVDRVVQIPAQPDQELQDDEQEFAEALATPPRFSPANTGSRISLASQLDDLPLDRNVLRPYFRLRDQVVALGPDMLPALGTGAPPRLGRQNSYREMRQGLVQ